MRAPSFVQLYAARFAPLYGDPADLTRGGAGDAAAATAAEEEGRGAAKVGWSLEQVAACLIAPPREGAPEADGALREAIAAAAAQVAALLTESDPSGRSFAPGVPSVLAADYVEEMAGWPDGAEVGRLLLLHLSTAPETAPIWAMWVRD